MKNKLLRRILTFGIVGTMLFTTACSSKTAKTDSTEAAVVEEGTAESASIETEETVEAKETETTEEATEVPSEDIMSFEDVNTDKVSLIALGNSDVPVGQYSQEVFENLGFWDAIQDKISFGTNVKEVLSQIEEGAVECGVVYATDAATSEKVTVVCTAPEGSLETPVIYPIAMLKETKHEEASKVFLNYLLTEESLAEFEKIGFKVATDTSPEEMEYTGEPCTINVFAAASLTESLTLIQNAFMEKYPDIEVVSNFDSSGTLKTQIEEGAEADIFFSAATKQMKALSEGGFAADETKIDLLENQVVLIVPKK
ncbi:MAG: molybdate ABC transporter substrate-binding protein [Lachnospiraceae bacterium]|nr:molybdate ABC transporter substrate-binding protein [Lachnospiraceae bacterium]